MARGEKAEYKAKGGNKSKVESKDTKKPTFYMLSKKDVLAKLATDATHGLKRREVEKRLRKYGENKLGEEKKASLWQVIISQFRNTVLWLLILAGIVSLFLGQLIEGLGIFLAVILSVAFGAYTEYKADESVEELNRYMDEKAIIIRDGSTKYISTRYIVPGDIVLLHGGQKVPCDLYLLEANDLEVDESILTGESKAVAKQVGAIKKKNVPLAERKNMLFAGTYVLKGNAKGVAIATGKDTVVGGISTSLAEVKEEETHLYKEVNNLSKMISIIAVVIILLFISAGYLKGFNLVELFLLAVTLAVAAIPEGLTTVLTIILGLSTKEMAKANALVRRLSTVDSLGRVDVVATDKTGTITEGKVRLIRIWYRGRKYERDGFPGIKSLFDTLLIPTEAKHTNKGFVGNEVDVAILEEAYKLGELPKKKAIKDVIPFSSERKYMAVEMEDGTVYMKGAHEVVLDRATHVLWDREYALTPKWKAKIEAMVRKEAEKQHRVLLFAKGRGEKLTVLALLVLSDPPKKGAKETIAALKKAGIAVVMLTGDNPLTAQAVAEEVGIEGTAVVWQALSHLDNGSLYKAVMKHKVIARVTPNGKLRIVDALVTHGHVVAVTGDGVNDAPALKKAHVGVVMGESGTTVSREVADIVLLDDNFSTLLKAIELGRNTLLKIKSFLRFQLTANFAAITLLFYGFVEAASNALTAFTLLPLQILWVNLIMDGPPALAQGFEPIKKEVLEKWDKGFKLIDREFITVVLLSALYMGTVSALLFFNAMPNYKKALALSFNSIVFFQLWNALNARSMKSHFYEKLLKNRVLIYTLLIMGLLQLLFVYTSVGRAFFDIAFLSPSELILVIIITSSIVVLDEFRKMLFSSNAASGKSNQQ